MKIKRATINLVNKVYRSNIVFELFFQFLISVHAISCSHTFVDENSLFTTPWKSVKGPKDYTKTSK